MSFDRDQPRDDHGRFSGGDWAERRAGKLAGALTNKADKEGGFSYRTGGAKEDRVPKTGVHGLGTEGARAESRDRHQRDG